MMKIKALEKEMIKFVTIFKKTTNEDMNVNETIQDEQRLRQMEKQERFGLQLFKKDHLFQYINYLKGLQLELEIGDFYGAK